MGSATRLFMSVTLCCVGLGPATPAAAAPKAAVLAPMTQPGDDAMVGAVTAQIERAGYTPARIDPVALCDPAQLSTRHFDLLVLCDASALPSRSVRPIAAFLEAGGDLIALHSPLWQSSLVKTQDRWMTSTEFLRSRAAEPPPHVLHGFAPDNFAGWKRSTSQGGVSTVYETIDAGPGAGQRALHVRVPSLDGWDMFQSPEMRKPFPAGRALTVFSARGSANTRQLSVEWTENDGSRWIAVIPLATEWSQYVLSASDFRYWESNAARGHGGDHLRVENAARLSVGVAWSHTGRVDGAQEYWVGPIGTAPADGEYAQLLDILAPPTFDTLSPGYKLFDCTGVQSLRPAPDQAIVAGEAFDMPSLLRSPQPRPQGGGFDKGRSWRWIPLIEARTARGEWRGTPATLMAHVDGPTKGGMWASFGVADPAWYSSASALEAIGRAAAFMKHGAFILDGGADYYTYFDKQAMNLGVRIGNLSAERCAGLVARVSVTPAGAKSAAYTKEWPVDLAPGEVKRLAETWTPTEWPAGGFKIEAQLASAGAVIDRVTHEAHVWRLKEKKEFVIIEDGHFRLNGKRWRASGVNYMPSSGIGTEDGDYFERWMGARAYDPLVIQRDLDHIRDLGLNAVSIFLEHASMRAQNLLDLLRRLDLLGMKANLMIRPSTPMRYNGEKARELIEYYRLPENDTVFAYDLDWEPMFRGHAERQPWDREWEAWIVERYGSVAAAEKDWGFKIPRDEKGAVTNPLPQHTDIDGDWRRMVAAYRRFCDTLLYKKYGAARRFLRNIDPVHYASFRMAEAGNPTMRFNGWMPYDFPYLAAALDFLSPEAYGRIGDWDKIRPAWFEYEYARWAAPSKPMIWAEMGVSAWDIARHESSAKLLEMQGQFYRDFYRMLVASGADGVFSWWYPGGFRVGENSDYGIINPDGSDRPASLAIRENSRKFLDGPDARPVNHWIEIDRDAHPDGVAGIYDKVSKEFWIAVESGRVPGLRTAGTGTDSSNCPLVAVGNTPCNGTNPPKYLDAAFNAVEILAADGKWKRVEPSGKVEVVAGHPVLGRVEVANLGEAKWIAGRELDRHGTVYLVTAGGAVHVPLPEAVAHLGTVRIEEFQVAPMGVTAATDASLRLEAAGRTPFGEKFTFTLVPR